MSIDVGQMPLALWPYPTELVPKRERCLLFLQADMWGENFIGIHS